MTSVLLLGALACGTPDPVTERDPLDTTDSIEKDMTLGPVSATVQLSPTEATLGDPVHLRLQVISKENVEVTLPPFGEALGRFQISNFQPREHTNDDGSQVQSQTYALQAPMSGLQRIPSLRIVFRDLRPNQNPEEQELLTEEIAIPIRGLLDEDAPLEFHAAKGTLVKPVNLPLWAWSLAALPLLGLGLVAQRRYRSWKQAEIVRTSYEQALEALLALQQGFDPETGIDLFYAQLSMIVRRYLESRFGLHAPELTTEELLAKARTLDTLSVPHQQFLRDFLARADAIKFAQAQSTSQNALEEITHVRVFLEETRPAEDSEQ